jgi:hypothetical protein
MKKHIALIFAASSLLLASCSTTAHHAKWEYQTVYSLAQANQWTDQGWVVAGFSAYVDTGNHDMTAFLLKRPKQ